MLRPGSRVCCTFGAALPARQRIARGEQAERNLPALTWLKPIPDSNPVKAGVGSDPMRPGAARLQRGLVLGAEHGQVVLQVGQRVGGALSVEDGDEAVQHARVHRRAHHVRLADAVHLARRGSASARQEIRAAQER